MKLIIMHHYSSNLYFSFINKAAEYIVKEYIEKSKSLDYHLFWKSPKEQILNGKYKLCEKELNKDSYTIAIDNETIFKALDKATKKLL